MAHLLHVSEAASLGIHAMALLAESQLQTVSARTLAHRLNASEAHLAKVLQRLTKAGLLKSLRGPSGGFSLRGNPSDISLLRIYEAIEGHLEDNTCLFERPICNGTRCIFGGLLGSISKQVRDYLAATTLARFSNSPRLGCDSPEVKD
jgi:Rrf2 family protein